MRDIIPLTQAARARAEGADPNQRRCLIQNCCDDDIVELAYVFPREHSGDSGMMKSIEYTWGMREGTLNLDTRRNVFFLGQPLHNLYKKGRWALCPEESVIDKFLSKPTSGHLGSPLARKNFPDLSDSTFRYTFLPLSEMSFGILRQNQHPSTSLDDYTVHRHPFATLPVVTSHVHPKFVLLQLSKILINRQRNPYIRNLIQANPVLRKVTLFYPNWHRVTLPTNIDSDPTFVSLPSPAAPRFDSEYSTDSSSQSSDAETDEYYEPSDGDSTSTPPRRIWYPPPIPRHPPPPPWLKRPACSSTSSGAHLVPPAKQRKLDDASGWTAASIAEWARGSSSSPEPPSSPSAPDIPTS
ncbi:hypothetical protein FA13DRAFT_1802902 [Coprinellus micaceus]|uniref:HNH nuclease domain-containing protein n=1 Tax=Coprinellus micaceus TaxID=71717 RepID=A0A4Y7SB72_COPMI|nr:hypothetical protein FA13DRAFT_1802902 [Coprinellus micaceus]